MLRSAPHPNGYVQSTAGTDYTLRRYSTEAENCLCSITTTSSKICRRLATPFVDDASTTARAPNPKEFMGLSPKMPPVVDHHYSSSSSSRHHHQHHHHQQQPLSPRRLRSPLAVGLSLATCIPPGRKITSRFVGLVFACSKNSNVSFLHQLLCLDRTSCVQE